MSYINSECKRLSRSNVNFKFTLKNPSPFEFWDAALWQFILLSTFYVYNENIRCRNKKVEMPTNIHWNFTENWKIMVSRSAFRLKCMFLHSVRLSPNIDISIIYLAFRTYVFFNNISLFVRTNVQWKDSKNLFDACIIIFNFSTMK